MTLDREDIEAIAAAVVARLSGVIPAPALPSGISAPVAKLITLARVDPAAAKAEALRLNKEDSARRAADRRQQARQKKQQNVGAHRSLA